MIYIAGDKHGYDVIQIIKAYFKSRGIEYENLGVRSAEEDMALEEMIPRVTTKILESPINLGILTCGTGVGVVIGANKFKGIRASLATNEKLAEWSRTYDNCNVLCLVGWDAKKDEIEKILAAWLKAKFDGDAVRSEMLRTFDEWH